MQRLSRRYPFCLSVPRALGTILALAALASGLETTVFAQPATPAKQTGAKEQEFGATDTERKRFVENWEQLVDVIFAKARKYEEYQK